MKAKRRQANKQVHKIKSSSKLTCFRLFLPTLEDNSLEVLQQRHLAVLLDLVQRDGVKDGLDQPAVVRQDKDPAEEEEEEDTLKRDEISKQSEIKGYSLKYKT